MQLTPGKNFRLKKPAKMLLANVVDAQARTSLKHALIQAQLHSEVQPPKEKGPRRNDRAGE